MVIIDILYLWQIYGKYFLIGINARSINYTYSYLKS